MPLLPALSASAHDCAREAAGARVCGRARGFAEKLSGEAGCLPGAAAALVEALRDPALALAGVWHPYGFFIVRVADFADYGTLRLHVWPPAARRVQQPAWPIHAHSWHLWSYVVAGTVENVWYDALPGGAHPLYACTRRNGAAVMRRTDARVSVCLRARQRVRAGSDYAVGMGTYHETRVAEGTFAATLALTRRGTDPYDAAVVGAADAGDCFGYPREEVPSGLVASALERLGREAQ